MNKDPRLAYICLDWLADMRKLLNNNKKDDHRELMNSGGYEKCKREYNIKTVDLHKIDSIDEIYEKIRLNELNLILRKGCCF